LETFQKKFGNNSNIVQQLMVSLQEQAQLRRESTMKIGSDNPSDIMDSGGKK
jgi:hypothetical protein